MRIGELSAVTGVSTRLLRYYEERGLIRSERLPNGYRDYDDDQVQRTDQVRSLIDSGIPTRVILEIIPCLEFPDKPVRSVLDPFVVAMLRAERDRMTERVANMQRNRDALTTYLEAVESSADAADGAGPPPAPGR
jgi:DNA-binding transcriptional MerR regulator